MVYVAGFITLGFGALLIIGAKRNWSITSAPERVSIARAIPQVPRLSFDRTRCSVTYRPISPLHPCLRKAH